MKFVWFCTHEKSWGADYEKCGALSRKPASTREAAEKGANAHTKRTGHRTIVEARDGRKLRKWRR